MSAAIKVINNKPVNFGSTHTYVYVYGKPDNWHHNSDYVIGRNHDDTGMFLYVVHRYGVEVFFSGKLSACADFCEADGAEPGEFYDEAWPGGRFLPWNYSALSWNYHGEKK